MGELYPWLASAPGEFNSHSDMAKTLFKHSRKGDINDYYNMQEGELGRYVESFVQCFVSFNYGLSILQYR